MNLSGNHTTVPTVVSVAKEVVATDATEGVLPIESNMESKNILLL
ncbi:hypothetical protein ABDH65_11600 [Heyndrickxia ginsengihumi]